MCNFVIFKKNSTTLTNHVHSIWNSLIINKKYYVKLNDKLIIKIKGENQKINVWCKSVLFCMCLHFSSSIYGFTKTDKMHFFGTSFVKHVDVANRPCNLWWENF